LSEIEKGILEKMEGLEGEPLLNWKGFSPPPEEGCPKGAYRRPPNKEPPYVDKNSSEVPDTCA